MSRGRWKTPPGYVPLHVVMEWLKWTRQRTIRWGVKEKFLVKKNGQWVSTKRRILLAFPELSSEHLQ